MRKALAALALIASPLALATDLGGDGLGGPSLQPRAQSAQLGEPGIANREISQVDPVLIEAGEPALDFRFAKNKNLTESTTNASSLITFSRSAAQSPGTYVGADGLIHDAAVNLALYSEQFDNAWWSKIDSTVTANQAIAPDGKQTADLISYGVGGILYRYVGIATGTYTFSVWLKGNAGEKTVIQIRGSSDHQKLVTFTGDWQREFVTSTNGAQNIYLPDGRVAGVTATSFYAWGAQLEETDPATMQPTAYIHTTSQALAAPRFDHDPVTGESLGLLVEEQRANLIVRSEEFDNGYWNTSSGVSVFANEVVSPDGKQTADRIVATGASPLLAVLFSPSIPAGYRRSIWAKVPSGTATVHLMGHNTDPSTLFTLTDQWQRFDVESNVGPSTDYFYAVDFRGSSTATEVHLWGAQLEAGSFPTSYIPTSGSSQTRYADVAAVEGTDFSSFYDATEGTVFAVASSVATGTRGIVGIDDNTANERIELQTDGTDPEFVVIDGGAGSTLDTGTITAYTFFNLTGAYKHNDLAATVGGVAVQTATDTLPTVDRMRIGVLQASGTYLNGHIKRLTYWPRRQADA
jgi:hypothetical protein